MKEFAIGVDLGGTNLRIAAVDEQGRILEKITTGTEVARGRDRVIDEMCAAIHDLNRKHGQASRLQGIGVGVPGIINLKTGMLHASPNLPGWEDYPVREEIEQRLSIMVILENDANAATLGEKWLGAGVAVDDMCMLTLGTGVGGGLVLGGRIWHGMTGMAGELGHINVEAKGPPCGCGSRGCLEQYASAQAVKRMAVEAAAEGGATRLALALNDSEFTAETVHTLAKDGDEPAREVFRRLGTALGIAVASLVNIFNLPMYVIGGGVSSAWDAFAPSMFQAATDYSYIFRVTTSAIQTNECSRTLNEPTVITRARLGSDAGLVGAARLPLLDRTPARQA